MSDLPAQGFAARRDAGRAERRGVPRSAHARWQPVASREDPMLTLRAQDASRVPELVPIRYGRMLASPFSFYRGAAAIMAGDLASTPTTNLVVQLCGDAHLSNFGLFGTPERSLIFDINDFDETLPGPFEWDVKRLAASFEVAGIHRGFSDRDRRRVTVTSVRAYRERMRAAADGPVLAGWYDRLDADRIMEWVRSEERAGRAHAEHVDRAGRLIAKARTRDSDRQFVRLVGVLDGRLRILADPPLVVPVEQLRAPGGGFDDIEDAMRHLLLDYRSTLQHDGHPIRDFDYVHMARRVGGVGSVGMRSWVLLLTGRDDADPLLLQAKEAGESVLERYLGPGAYENHGERVVRGQRLMQAASDIFLGWQRVVDQAGAAHDFYLRQLHDWKGSIDPEEMSVSVALLYARLCGETLARAHARSGDRVAIAAYLGASDRFDEAVADFARSYAAQNDADYARLLAAINEGEVEAQPGV